MHFVLVLGFFLASQAFAQGNGVERGGGGMRVNPTLLALVRGVDALRAEVKEKLSLDRCSIVGTEDIKAYSEHRLEIIERLERWIGPHGIVVQSLGRRRADEPLPCLELTDEVLRFEERCTSDPITDFKPYRVELLSYVLKSREVSERVELALTLCQ